MNHLHLTPLLKEKIDSLKSYIEKLYLRKFPMGLETRFKKDIDVVLEGFNKIIRSMEESDYEALNIAFFGETNSGKSTLIEALIGGDGSTIGDGRKDFTRSILATSIGEKIRIMDMPGIEGNETKVLKEIQKAVEKAHIIFYVYHDTKELERGTLEKLRNYLRRNSEVYAILNLRGIFPQQVMNEKMKTARVIAKRTEKHLKNVLGDIYKGTLIVHALFAFFSRAKRIPEHLKEQFQTSISFYKARDKLEEISKISDVLELIKSSEKDHVQKILWGNLRKILVYQEEILGVLLDMKTHYDNFIDELIYSLERLKLKIMTEIRILRDNLRIATNTHLKEFRDEIYMSLVIRMFSNGGISLKHIISKEANRLKELLVDYIENEFSNFMSRIRKHVVSIEKRSNIDLEHLLKNLDLGVQNILSKTTEKISTISVPVILIETKTSKKALPKSAIDRRFELGMKELSTNINLKISDILRAFTELLEGIKSEIDRLILGYKEFSKNLNEIVYRLMIIIAEESTSLAKQINPEVKFAYIQDALGEGSSIAVVVPITHDLYSKLKNLGFRNIYVYESMDHLVKDALSKKGEFFKRLRRVLNIN